MLKESSGHSNISISLLVTNIQACLSKAVCIYRPCTLTISQSLFAKAWNLPFDKLTLVFYIYNCLGSFSMKNFVTH